jgi:tellurite resistance-related uncharacterized protein
VAEPGIAPGALALPDGVEHVRSTPPFDADTVPAGLLGAHQTAEGVWGRLVVEAGSVDLVFEDEGPGTATVVAGASAAIPPGRPHHVVPGADARFRVEFHR